MDHIKLPVVMIFNPQPKPEPSGKKKPKRLRSVSIRREHENKLESQARKEHLKENPYCAICAGKATTIHHKKGRIGSLLYDRRWFLSTCLGCHTIIERNPEWAKEKGYSLDRLCK